jgi:hypothetical protein
MLVACDGEGSKALVAFERETDGITSEAGRSAPWSIGARVLP